MPIANLGLQRAMEAMNRGWGDRDSTIIFKLQEEASGVEVRAPQVDPQKSARFISTHPDFE